MGSILGAASQPAPLTTAGPVSLFNIAATAELSKIRQGRRSFQTVDTFEDLRYLKCDSFVARNKNLVYPMLGSIGMKKVIHTFVELTRFGGAGGAAAGGGLNTAATNTKKAEAIAPQPDVMSGLGMTDLALMPDRIVTAPAVPAQARKPTAPIAPANEAKKKDEKPTDTKETSKDKVNLPNLAPSTQSAQPSSNAKAFVDTLIFTTQWTGGINPKLVVSPLTDALRVAEVNVNLTASRQDVHQVIISLTFPDPASYAGAKTATAISVRRDAALQVSKNQALINLCIAQNKAVEQAAGVLRQNAPEQYCSRY